MSTIQKRFLFVLLTMILSCHSFAYYNQKQGRWLTRDPLGVNPSLGRGTVSPATQYKDGYNIYEYVRSKPIMKRDAYGLTSDEKVCCKGRKSFYFFKPCFQKSHSNPKGFPPKILCECIYKKKSNFLNKYTVQKAKPGNCCWCDAYLIRQPLEIEGLEWLTAHFVLEFRCGEEFWATDVSGTGRPRDYDYKTTQYGQKTYSVGRISCDQKVRLRAYAKTVTWKYDFWVANCAHYVAYVGYKAAIMCPY